MAAEQKRYVIIHGHFYQPPRESPWTGLISRGAQRGPFPNWNERILSESYAANAHAHTMDGPVVRISNNYQSLSFDFGPTLIAWLARHGTSVYRSVIRADAMSVERNDGHGNAIAQSYNHSILPLLTERGQRDPDRMGNRGFRLPLRTRTRGHVAARMRGRRGHARRRWRARASSSLSWRRGRASSARMALITNSAGPFIWRRGDLSLGVFRFDPTWPDSYPSVTP